MEIEFDPAKAQTKLAKHGLSLRATEGFEWDNAIGLIDDRVYVLVSTEGSDENVLHAISLRPAEKHEARFTMPRFDPETGDDNPPMDAAFMAGMTPSRCGRPKLETPKVEVKIRLDAKTVEHLRESGPGWQTRINAALSYCVARRQI